MFIDCAKDRSLFEGRLYFLSIQTWITQVISPCSQAAVQLSPAAFAESLVVGVFCTRTPASTPGVRPHKAPRVLLRDWLTMMQWGMTEGAGWCFFSPLSSPPPLEGIFFKVIDSAGNSVAPSCTHIKVHLLNKTLT